MHAIKFALFAAIACCSVPAIAQWQWTDAQGRKVFSDRAPPADIPAKDILRRPGGAKSAAPAVAPEAGAAAAKPSAEKGVDKGLEEQKRKQQEQESARAQADKLQKEKQRQDNCNRAKQAKATLASGRMLSHVNASGERGFMDEATRDAEIKRADAVIASDCGPMAEPAQ
ncbi:MULTISPECIES: DUF4124 domain-containing protein [Comamonas]|jgi:hypothetical protein|uniref:DUF4124 domain-containing protein n=1 Tax=Comamonas TaxID=283 RepID=UPI0025DFB933|nr:MULTISPECIES: DUF4124 domain-containing protein [Comamonas]MDR3064870.1 DUF4124 domain-containing protein [Comamonas sp.]MEB5965334.1 DUF4124 domain-containing protein [Comamonas testosteroni]